MADRTDFNPEKLAVLKDWKIEHVGGGILDLFGYSEEEMKGVNFRDLIDLEHGKYSVESRLDLLKHGNPVTFYTTFFRKDGSTDNHYCYCMPAKDSDRIWIYFYNSKGRQLQMDIDKLCGFEIT